MGFHRCPYCLESVKEPHQFSNHSTGDVNLSFSNGHRWVMPDMICHYVADHQWLPPQEFIDDVMDGTSNLKIQTVNYNSFAQRIADVLNGTRVGYLSGELVTGEVPDGFMTRLVAQMGQAHLFNMRLQTKGLPLTYIKEAAIKDSNGVVYIGHRHHKIFPLIPRELVNECVQGFVTNFDEFVTREKAAKIAFAAGQIPEPKKTLFSEDLW